MKQITVITPPNQPGTLADVAGKIDIEDADPTI